MILLHRYLDGAIIMVAYSPLASRMKRFILLAAAVVWAPQSFSQSTSAQCVPNYDWAKNSMGENPCLVVSHLQSQCTGAPVNVTALSGWDMYMGPSSAADATPCMCSTVLYSLFAACADCQGAGYQRWPQWSGNCSNVFVSIFPGEIPAQTSIPRWAYADVVSEGLYDPSIAHQISLEGMSMVSAPPASTGTISITATESVPSASQSNTQARDNAIAGGIVAGFIGLSILSIGVVLLLLRRRRSRIAPSTAYKAAYGLSPPPTIQRTQTQRFSVLASPTTPKLDESRVSPLLGVITLYPATK